MSAITSAPDIHQWVDELTPIQQDFLRVIVSDSDLLPAISSKLSAPDASFENWLRTEVLPVHYRVVAGGGRPVSLDEARSRISTTLATKK